MIQEGAELTGESGKTYLAVSTLGQANVWTAVQKDKPTNIVVIKEPNADERRPGWPSFIHEMIMHELFKENASTIRQCTDRIPPQDSTSPPMLVLEIFQTTLWTARTKRPMSKAETRTISKAILKGLRDVHAKNMVYADLKMQNVMLNGFDVAKPVANPAQDLSVKLGDLGIVMHPERGQVQPIAYRAPEVYFKGQIMPSADIWSWGLIYAHLLEAQNRFQQTGIYDDLNTGGGTMREREDATKHAIANDYDIRNVDYYTNTVLPKDDPGHGIGQQWDALEKRGLEDGEIRFLRWVMKVDPRERPTAEEILASGWLDDSGHVKTRKGLASFAKKQGNESGRPVSRSSFFRSESDPGLDALSRQISNASAASSKRGRDEDDEGGKEDEDEGAKTPTIEQTPASPQRPLAQRTFLSYR